MKLYCRKFLSNAVLDLNENIVIWQIDGFSLKTRYLNVKVSAGKGKAIIFFLFFFFNIIEAIIGVKDMYAENGRKWRKTNRDLDVEYFPGN